MPEEKSKIDEFKVVDKRGSQQGEQAAPTSEQAEQKASAQAEAAKSYQEAAKQQAGHEVTFTSFIFSLSTEALIHLGELPDPVQDKKEENLVSAKQLIDILGIIKEKTRGNLKPEESMLLDNWLYELRMKYLEKTKQIKT